jgi:hypothetical protein
VRMMARKIFKVISYIDDFLCVGDTLLECQNCYDYLLELLTGLGHTINLEKVEAPCVKLSFLGVSIDCISRTLSLPQKKLDSLRVLLTKWSTKRKCRKSELQSIVGYLNWCCRVVSGGRTFMRELINLLPRARETHHFIRLNRAAKDNIRWWLIALDYFHGKTPFISDVPLPSYCLATDACASGGGAHFFNDWLYINWNTDVAAMSDCHINVLELEMVNQAALRWGERWSGRHVLIRSDNAATVAAINKGSTRSVELLRIVEKLFWLSVKFGYKLTASFIPGIDNVLADRISRMIDPIFAVNTQNLLTNGSCETVTCKGHMSYSSYLLLQEMWSWERSRSC